MSEVIFISSEDEDNSNEKRNKTGNRVRKSTENAKKRKLALKASENENTKKRKVEEKETVFERKLTRSVSNASSKSSKDTSPTKCENTNVLRKNQGIKKNIKFDQSVQQGTSKYFDEIENKISKKDANTKQSNSSSASVSSSISPESNKTKKVVKPQLVVKQKVPIPDPLDNVFENLLILCKQKKDDEISRKILSNLNKIYQQLTPVDRDSDEFRLFINSIALKISNNNNFYLFLQELRDEIKRRIKLPKVLNSEDKKMDKEQEEDEQEIELSKDDKYKIRKLENALKKCQEKIKELEEAEVDFDDDSDSAYIKVDRYKRRAVLISSKLSELAGDKMLKKQILRKQLKRKDIPDQITGIISVDETIIDFINANIRKVNRLKHIKNPNAIAECISLPDYSDILNCINKCNKERGLGLTKRRMEDLALPALKAVGRYLQKIRIRESETYISSFIENESEGDPAVKNPVLNEKLRQNKKEGDEKLYEIFKTFESKQEKLTEEDLKEQQKTDSDKTDDETENETESIEEIDEKLKKNSLIISSDEEDEVEEKNQVENKLKNKNNLKIDSNKEDKEKENGKETNEVQIKLKKKKKNLMIDSNEKEDGEKDKVESKIKGNEKEKEVIKNPIKEKSGNEIELQINNTEINEVGNQSEEEENDTVEIQMKEKENNEVEMQINEENDEFQLQVEEENKDEGEMQIEEEKNNENEIQIEGEEKDEVEMQMKKNENNEVEIQIDEENDEENDEVQLQVEEGKKDEGEMLIEEEKKEEDKMQVEKEKKNEDEVQIEGEEKDEVEIQMNKKENNEAEIPINERRDEGQLQIEEEKEKDEVEMQVESEKGEGEVQTKEKENIEVQSKEKDEDEVQIEAKEKNTVEIQIEDEEKNAVEIQIDDEEKNADEIQIDDEEKNEDEVQIEKEKQMDEKEKNTFEKQIEKNGDITSKENNDNIKSHTVSTVLIPDDDDIEIISDDEENFINKSNTNAVDASELQNYYSSTNYDDCILEIDQYEDLEDITEKTYNYVKTNPNSHITTVNLESEPKGNNRIESCSDKILNKDPTKSISTTSNINSNNRNSTENFSKNEDKSKVAEKSSISYLKNLNIQERLSGRTPVLSNILSNNNKSTEPIQIQDVFNRIQQSTATKNILDKLNAANPINRSRSTSEDASSSFIKVRSFAKKPDSWKDSLSPVKNKQNFKLPIQQVLQTLPNPEPSESVQKKSNTVTPQQIRINPVAVKKNIDKANVTVIRNGKDSSSSSSSKETTCGGVIKHTTPNAIRYYPDGGKSAKERFDPALINNRTGITSHIPAFIKQNRNPIYVKRVEPWRISENMNKNMSSHSHNFHEQNNNSAESIRRVQNMSSSSNHRWSPNLVNRNNVMQQRRPDININHVRPMNNVHIRPNGIPAHINRNHCTYQKRRNNPYSFKS